MTAFLLRAHRGCGKIRRSWSKSGLKAKKQARGWTLLNFIELHHDSTGNAVTINIHKIISYERVPGRSFTDLLTGRENMTVRETPSEISQLIIAAQARTS
jgi:hypothetical protein